MHSDTDVLVVGAGPVGMTLALLLARRGRTVAVYERFHTAFPLPRAAAMSHESVRTFQSTGLLEQMRSQLDFEDQKLGASIYGPGNEVLATMTFTGQGRSGFPPMVGFHQPDLDALLGEMCDADPLVEMHRGWDARAITQGNDDAVVTFDPIDGDQPRDGEPVSARGAFVVGCDGANSVVRSLTDTEVTDTGFSSRWLVVDALLAPGATAGNLFGHVLDPERPASLVPAGRNRQRYEMMTVEGDDLDRITDEESVWPLIERWGMTRDQGEVARSALYTFRGRWAETWRDGRVLLAGDAAHQMPPFLGQGFNSGVRDAVALAWRIDLVLDDRAGIELLDSYTSERLPHVQQIVDSSVAIGRMLCNTDPQVVDEQIAALRAANESGTASMAQSEWRLGPGCLVPDDPAAGFTGRQGRVEKDGTTGLLDDLVGAGRFVLFGNGVDPGSGLSDEARSVWRKLGGLTVTIGADGFVDVEGSYADWFDELGAAVVLVRPDFQVYGASADAQDADDLVRGLAGHLHLRAAVTVP